MADRTMALFQELANKDYCGTDISLRRAISLDLGRSFFNGARIGDCEFSSCNFSNSEFAEAVVERATFSKCVISGADFINSLLRDCEFDGCELAEGEWRSSEFVNCNFIKCDFYHNTITLCSFKNCTFDSDTILSMQHRAIYANVFMVCDFATPFTEEAIFTRNFGVPVEAHSQSLIAPSLSPSLEHICLLNNIGTLRAIDVANAADGFAEPMQGLGIRRGSAILFFSNILVSLCNEKRVSSTTLTYVEEVVTRIAGTATERDYFVASMSALVQIREALLAISNECAPDIPPEDVGSTFATKIRIYFHETFSKEEVEDLCEALNEAGNLPPGALRVERIEWGSTAVDLAVMGVTVSSALISVNLVLRQATIFVERMTQFAGALITFKNQAFGKKVEGVSTPVTEGRVPAILGNGAVSEKLAPVRASVRKKGKRLAKLDEAANVTIYC